MKIKQIIRGILCILCTVIPGAVFLYIPIVLQHNQAAAESYSRNIFPWISRPVEFVSSLIPISLTEVLIVFAALSSVFWLGLLTVRFVRAASKREFLFKFVLFLGILFSVVTVSFTLMHGINYARVPLDKTLALDSVQKSPKELVEVTAWLEHKMAQSRDGLKEDKNGCMVLSTNIARAFEDGNTALDLAAKTFPVLSGNKVLAKPVNLSHYWSYTGITGMYFPFFGEANINTDVPDSQIPIIICHEISHTRGIAREQDANLAGFLGCISSDRQDYEYCAYQYAFLYCAWDLSFADEDGYNLIMSSVPDAVRRDWNQNAEYWAEFEGPVQKASIDINDSYLQANLQEEGVKSYDRVTDLIINYYFTYVKGR